MTPMDIPRAAGGRGGQSPERCRGSAEAWAPVVPLLARAVQVIWGQLPHDPDV
jgi:hypothetical protein